MYIDRYTQELEGQVDILDEAVEEVSRTAKPIGYARRKLPPTPKETLPLGNLEETARLAASSRGTEEPSVDPDEELDQVLASITNEGEAMDADPEGSSLLNSPPLKGSASSLGHVATPQSVRTTRSTTMGSASASQHKHEPP